MGFYSVFYFSITDTSQLTEIEKILSIHNSILRYIIIKIDKHHIIKRLEEYKKEQEEEQEEEAREKEKKAQERKPSATKKTEPKDNKTNNKSAQDTATDTDLERLG